MVLVARVAVVGTAEPLNRRAEKRRKKARERGLRRLARAHRQRVPRPGRPARTDSVTRRRQRNRRSWMSRDGFFFSNDDAEDAVVSWWGVSPVAAWLPRPPAASARWCGTSSLKCRVLPSKGLPSVDDGPFRRPRVWDCRCSRTFCTAGGVAHTQKRNEHEERASVGSSGRPSGMQAAVRVVPGTA